MVDVIRIAEKALGKVSNELTENKRKTVFSGIFSKIQDKLQIAFGKDLYGFLSHSKNYISASLFTQGLSIITVPIFTRLLLPKDYGVLAILYSFIAIFSILYGLSTQGSIVRYYYEGSNDFDKFLGSTLTLIIIWCVLFTCILLVFRQQLQIFFQIPLNVIYIGISISALTVFFTLYQSYLQASKQSKKVALLTIIQRIVGIIIAILLILSMQDEKYYGRAYAMLIIAGIVCCYSLCQLKKLSRITFKKKYLKYSLFFSLPVVFHLLSQYILTSFDQIIINQLIGKMETGLYSLAYNVGMLQQMVIMGMLTAWSPIFYEKLNKQRYNEINKLASQYARFVYLAAFTLILFSRELIIILADKKYYSALEIVPIIIISYVFFFLYAMYVNFAFYHKKTYLIAIITIIAGAINIGLNYWLIPFFGYKVAAWTTLVSYASLFVLHYMNVRFIIKPEWITQLRVLLPNFFIMIGFVLVYAVIFRNLHQFILLFVLKMLLASGLIYIYFRKSINDFFVHSQNL